jgi:NAD(P)H-dependent FMN reductase
MASTPRVLAFAGSLRRDSFNKRLVKIAANGARALGAEVTEIDLRELPLPIYDGDLEAAEGLPANAKKLKEIFLAHQGLLISSPEYNSSISAALKNTIDWVSRPAPNEAPLACFSGKVVSLMAASPGGFGGLRGLVTVRSILGNIQCIVLPEQVCVAKAHEAFDAEGKLKDAKQSAQVEKLGANVVGMLAKIL